ncbi:MAG: SDR family oxidoreductase [Halieaceae bacterium]|nr:SDR family oxidoreductase [Halieaceae bacterium]
MSDNEMKRVLVAGATGYLGKYAVQMFKRQGYYVRVLTRSEERLREPGPFTAPALSKDDFDDIFVGEVTKPETLVGMLDDIDLVFSCVGISRQRDGLTFEQVDYQCNMNLIDLCASSSVKRFVYVSMQGAENIMQLAITQAHEKVVTALKNAGMDYRIVRPCGYFSDMGALYDMAKRGRSFLVGEGTNLMNPIHGRALARVCVETAEGDELEVEAGGPEVMTQKEAAALAFEVVGKPEKIHVIPMWLARGLVKFIGLLSNQFGDLAEFIVTAGEIDGVGPKRGTTTLRSYFEALHAGKPDV